MGRGGERGEDAGPFGSLNIYLFESGRGVWLGAYRFYISTQVFGFVRQLAVSIVCRLKGGLYGIYNVDGTLCLSSSTFECMFLHIRWVVVHGEWSIIIYATRELCVLLQSSNACTKC